MVGVMKMVDVMGVVGIMEAGGVGGKDRTD